MHPHVHILVPSGKLDFSLIDGAKARLESWGFRCSESLHARSPQGRFGGSVEDRRADLVAALINPDIDYILCARGGYGVVQLLTPELLDVARQSHARIVGFSDITALHALMAQVGKPSLHAVMCKHLTEYDTHREACDGLRQALLGETLRYELPAHPLNRVGEAEGILLGGNLSVFYGLQGTPFSPFNSPYPSWGKGSGKRGLLFLEDIGERPYAVDRMMHNLRLSGVLDRAAAVVVGQFSDYEEDPLMLGTVYENIRRVLEPYRMPVVFDFPAGHVERNLPLWLNAPCRLSVTPQGTTLISSPA